jgi:hypothetical protein
VAREGLLRPSVQEGLVAPEELLLPLLLPDPVDLLRPSVQEGLVAPEDLLLPLLLADPAVLLRPSLPVAQRDLAVSEVLGRFPSASRI